MSPPPAPLRRFAAIGDLHGEDLRLEFVLTWLSGQGIDAVLAVGDLVDGAGSLDRCCALLTAHAALVVRGNHDRWLLEEPFAHQPGFLARDTLRFLRALPVTRRLPTLRGDLLLCHGVGDNDMVRLHPQAHETSPAATHALDLLLADAALRLVVGGHTHRRMVRSFARPDGPPAGLPQPRHPAPRLPGQLRRRRPRARPGRVPRGARRAGHRRRARAGRGGRPAGVTGSAARDPFAPRAAQSSPTLPADQYARLLLAAATARALSPARTPWMAWARPVSSSVAPARRASAACR